MSIPVFTSVVYLSPWLPVPPGWSKVGVDATVTAPPSGSNLALAGRLRQGATTLQVQVGATATEVVIVPTAPLSSALDYYVDVQWVAQGTQPGSIVWTTPNTVATSPVVTAIATLVSGAVAGSAVSLSWNFAGAAITPAGANLSAYNAAGTSAGFKRVQGTTGTLTLNAQATPTGTTLYLQAVMPISGAPGAGFTAPFSAGPILSGAPLPLAAPALTSAAYDGASVQVAWTAPAAPTTGGTIGYDLAVTAGTAAATMFAAGAGGGMAVLGGTPAGSALSVAGRVRIGAIAGASGTPQALLPLPPLLDQIAISGNAVSVRGTFPAGAPAGAVAQLRLMRNGVSMGTAQAATSGATVQIAGLTAALDGWTVQGAMSATVSGAALSGPPSLPLPVPTAAPVIRAIAMTPDPSGSGGWSVTLDASAPPPPDASLSVTLSQGGTTIASQSIADGASASFTLAQGNAAANVIDGTKVANASLAIVTASGTSPVAAATFVGAAPTVTAVQNIGAGDPGGQPQGLQVDASGGVSGQLLALQLTAGGKVVATATGATATHANLPLSQPLDPSLAWFIQARWTGAGVTAATFGGWSAPVAVLTATTNVVSAEYDNKQLILTIAPPAGVAPAQGAYLFAQQVSGGAIKGVSVIGTRGTISVDATAGNWQAGAKPFQPLPSGASSRTLAPSSALAPILTAAPSLATLGYDGASLSASWTIAVDGAGNAATGALLQVSDGVGTISTLAAGSASGEAQIQLPAGAQGAATVRVRATRNSSAGTYSGAWSVAAAPLVAAPSLGTVALNAAGTAVGAVLTLPAGMPAGTSYQAWLMAGDHVAAGPVTAVTNAGVTTVSIAYAAAGVAGLSILAQAQASVGGVALTGPRSASVPVLATAPTIASVLIAPSATSGRWQLDARWSPPADGAAITIYTLALLKAADSSVVVQAAFGTAEQGSLTFSTSAVNATEAYSLTLMATSANGSTTPVAATPVWFAASAFTAVTTGETQVSGQWTAPVGPTGAIYQLRLLDNAAGATLATIVTSATSGGIDTSALGLRPGGAYVLALGIQLGPVLFQPGADGTAATRPPLLTQAPTIGTVTIDIAASTVGAILTPPAGMLAGAGYQAWLMAGDQIVAGPVAGLTASGTTRISFSYAAAGVSGLSIIAQALATLDGVALTGPPSAPAPVLAFAPSLAAVLVATAPDPTKWQLGAGWIPPADGTAIVTYGLKLSDDDGAVVAEDDFGSATAGALSFLKSAVGATAAYTLTLEATSANNSVTPLASAAIWFASAAFTSVTTGQSQVNAQWTAPAGPVGIVYRLQLLNSANGAVLATTTTSATSGGIDIAGLGLQPGGAYALDIGIQLGIVLFEAGSDGTAKTRPALLLASPLGLTAATNAATGKAVLSWTAVAGASGYTLAFSDGTTASAPGASYAFAAPLAAGEDLRVTITANVVSAGVTSTGPASAPFAMPTLAPALTQADYDGTNVSGAWEPVAGATSYLVTALDAEGAIAAAGAPTAGTSVSFAASLVAADGPFTIVVQAVTEAGTGLPSAPLPVFQTAWFVSTDPPSSEPPNIYPAATLALSPTQISIYLPPLANSTITVAKVGAFDLTSNTDATTKAALPYVLTFAADSNVWAFSADDNPLPAIRPQVQTDYVTFLKAAETAGASSWGISVLQLAISRWMPQTFEESHYYAYGLSLGGGNGTGSIDLRQGLVLRVGFANYTNVWSGDTDSWLNGFGGGSPSDFDVADSMSIAGAWQLTMDAFIARLTASGAMSVLPPATLVSAESAAGVADAADLFFPSFPNPFYRLFFPGQLENPTGTGSVSTAANFALTSAATYTALGTSSPTPGATTLVAYFRGRAVLRLMIRVRVNGIDLVVPLGTTVGNLLDRYGVRPPATQIQLTGVTIERAAGPGLAVFGASAMPPPLVYDAARRYMVRLDWATMATYGGPTDATNLPLLHGDRIDF